MKIQKNKSYICENSDLKVHVVCVYYSCKEYTKIKARCINKKNGLLYDVRIYKVRDFSNWLIYN